jgi:hypothetical protein
MQLSALATILLYAYILYGLFWGGFGTWSGLSPAEKTRLLGIVNSVLLYTSIALGVLLLTVSVLHYEEESLGYALVAAAVCLYYGLPFMLEQSSYIKDWQTSNNQAALAIYRQFQLAGLILAVPGIILTVRDLILRMVDGSKRNREKMSGMQYGGAVKEEAPVGSAPIGMLARCWQMVYCRDAIRVRCPIYHARTKCWKERVGCMCEENVIRHAMDALINKEIISFDKKKDDEGDPLNIGGDAPKEKTETFPKPVVPISRSKVKIPYNTTISMAAKRERCRNCVIFNEHQRLKYQFLSPWVVLLVPGLAILKFEDISALLNRALHAVDAIMARLSPLPNAGNTGAFGSITSTSIIAEYIIIGCLVIIVTTMALRALEYAVFKMKI